MMLQTLVAWVLEPGDPFTNDRRVEVLLAVALVLIWTAPVCMLLIMARRSQ